MTGRPRLAMTMAELMITASVVLVVCAMVLPAVVAEMRTAALDSVREDMRLEAKLAKACMLRDFSRTSLQQVTAEYDAAQANVLGIAMPVDAFRDGSGRLSWSAAVAYYLTPNADGTQALWRAEVSYADFLANRTGGQLIRDLRTGQWPSSRTGRVRMLLSRVSDYAIVCGTQVVNGYAPVYGKKSVFLGSAFLQPNANHTLRFECVGKDEAATGYGVVLDRLVASAAGTSLEAEALTITAKDAVVSVVHDRMGAAWGNNAVLSAPFTDCTPAAPKGVTLQFFTDLWCDTDFDGASSLVNVRRGTDPLAGQDIVMLMSGGNADVWTATAQAGTFYWGLGDDLQAQTVRVLLPGNLAAGYSPVTAASGGHPRITFQAGWGSSLKILEANIMERDEAAGGFDGTDDATRRWPIRFGGSAASPVFTGELVSDPVLGMDFDSNKSYLVSYVLPAAGTGGHHRPAMWFQLAADAAPLSAVTPGNAAAVAAWSTLPCAERRAVVGVRSVGVSFPCKGSFLSAVLDTKEDPNLPMLGPATVVRSDVANASIALFWRSGATADFSGSGESTWYNSVTALPDRRFVQYRADFATTKPIAASPMLREVRLTWIPSLTKAVDLGADIAVGPDLGRFVVKIDGQTPMMATIRLWFELERILQGERHVCPLTVEINPRNP